MKYVKRDIINFLVKKYDLNALDICDEPEMLVLNILGYILKQDVLKLKAENYLELTREDMCMLEDYIRQIAIDKIPPQYVIGSVSIYNENYIVTEDVLIPRPDTETLIEQVIMAINSSGYKNMLDLCTGSGVVGISVAKNSNIENVTLADISPAAIEIAKQNITRNGVEEKCTTLESNLFNNISKGTLYDIITANPPYISVSEYETLSEFVKKEPYIALVAVNNGLDMYIQIAKKAQDYLVDGGMLAFEIGYNQAEAVTNILQNMGCYYNIITVRDLNQKDRVLLCRFHQK
jgi:release factor glutamine methyltransferase